MKQILFVNGSPNRNGNTVEMAHRLLSGKGYETLHLVDYKIYPLGQSFADDQFDEVMQKNYGCGYSRNGFSCLLAFYDRTVQDVVRPHL